MFCGVNGAQDGGSSIEMYKSQKSNGKIGELWSVYITSFLTFISIALYFIDDLFSSSLVNTSFSKVMAASTFTRPKPSR